MLKNECILLPDALVVVFITTVIVSIVTAAVPIRVRAEDTVHTVSQRLCEREKEELRTWQGCRICEVEADTDM